MSMSIFMLIPRKLQSKIYKTKKSVRKARNLTTGRCRDKFDVNISKTVDY